jgi:hypothetical protein
MTFAYIVAAAHQVTGLVMSVLSFSIWNKAILNCQALHGCDLLHARVLTVGFEVITAVTMESAIF